MRPVNPTPAGARGAGASSGACSREQGSDGVGAGLEVGGGAVGGDELPSLGLLQLRAECGSSVRSDLCGGRPTP
jgi:hypothetical protein